MSKSLLNMKDKVASLAGPEWDSSDSETEAPSSKGMPSGDVVNLAEKKKQDRDKQKQKQKQKKVAKAPAAPASSAIYLGHLPPGFEEQEILGFLAQFGQVAGVHVSRSKKTGRSKGYAFVNFADRDVAKIVADTMSGYFLLERRLISHVLPAEQVRDDMFKAGKFRTVDWRGEHNKKVNRARTEKEVEGLSKRQSTRLTGRLEKLRAMGIDVGTADEMGGRAEVEEEEEEVVEVTKKAKKEKTPAKKEKATPAKKASAAAADKKEAKKTPKKAVEEKKTPKKAVEEKKTPAKKDEKKTPAKKEKTPAKKEKTPSAKKSTVKKAKK